MLDVAVALSKTPESAVLGVLATTCCFKMSPLRSNELLENATSSIVVKKETPKTKIERILRDLLKAMLAFDESTYNEACVRID
jgi:hypothetical protein